MTRTILMCLFMLLMTSGMIGAQPKIIAVDTTTGVPMESLPFHRPFFLKMLARSPKVVKVLLFEHIRNKALGSTLLSKTIRVVNRETESGVARADTVFETFYPERLDPSYYTVKKEGDKLYIYINFRDEYALKPSKQYSLAIYYSATPGTSDVFRLLHKSDSLGDGRDTTIRRQRAKLVGQAVEKYNAIARKASLKDEVFFGMFPLDYPTVKQLDTVNIQSIRANGVVEENYKWLQYGPKKVIEPLAKSFDVSQVQKLAAYYESKIRQPYKRIDSLNQEIDALLTARDTAVIPANILSAYDALMILFSSVDSLEHSKVREMFTQEGNRVLRAIPLLKRLRGPAYRRVASGYQPLLCDFCKPADSARFEGRIKYLEETIGDFQKIRLIGQVYQDREPGLKPLEDFLVQRIDDLTQVRALLKEAVKRNEEATSVINNSDQFNTADLTSANTFVFSFETRTKYSLVPEVGLLTNRVFKSGKGSNFLLIPYLGATINFSQLDRDVPFYLIRNKTIWDRTGLVLGWSLVSLKDSTSTPPRDDFFEKSSLVTGLSFRFSNTVKGVFGYNWFYKRAMDTGRRSLTNLPFVGLSFDLDVQKYLTGLFGAVNSLKGSPVKTSDTATP